MDNSEISQRFEKLASDRTTIQEMWDAIERYVTPYRGRFFRDNTGEHSVEWDKRFIYDSTAVMAHQILSASLHGSLTSPSIRWFQIRFREEKLNAERSAMLWLDECAEIVHYELQDSNFNLEINENYQDLVGPGTAFLMLEEGDKPGKWGGLNFTSVPLKESYFEEGIDGAMLRYYRMVKWTPQQLIAKFGDDVPDTIKKMEEKGATERQEVLFVIYPRHNKLTELGKKLAPSRRAYEFKYVLRASQEPLGKPGSYYEMPAFVSRWRKTSESIWGNSPAMIGMGDILTLNQARKAQLIMAEKIIDPPIFAEERALLTDLDLSSASINTVRNLEKIKPFNTEGNLPVSDHMIDQLQQAVRDYFFIDHLRMPAPQAQPMTATEVQMRAEQMQRLLGPTLGRLQNDLLDPIISRSFRMLARKGLLPDPPDVVRELNPAYDIDYMGSLARSQKVDEAAAVERFAMLGAQLAQIMPDVMDVPNGHGIMQVLAKSLNVPPKAVNGETEATQAKTAREQQQQQALQSAQGQAAGDAAQSQAAGAQAMSEAQAIEEQQ